MAESFVFDVANSLLGKLASYAYEEASRAYGVYDDLQGFKDTLSIVRGVLLDAEEKKDQRHGLREWLRQIQKICSDAEGVLEGFESQDMRKQDIKASGSNMMKVRHFFSSSSPLVFRPTMAHEIKEIRDRLDKVAADGTKFGLATINVEPRLGVQRREMTHSHVDASSVIGRKNDRKKIIKLLKQPHPHGDGDGAGDKSLCVIPVVGFGGMGKTTLAKLVFNDKEIDELFQLKMWVCVSDGFDIKQIIIKIINSASSFASASGSTVSDGFDIRQIITKIISFASASGPTVAFPHQENINHLDIEQLQNYLRHKLSGQKFLLVLDDICNDNRAKWIALTDLIKVGAAGSKILATTRSNLIASMIGTIPSYVLKGLSQKSSLSLFVKWAFKEGEEVKYPNLVEIGNEIVKKCRGIPLAIRTVGSSLFSNFDLNKWILVSNSEIWNLKQTEDDILPVLKLSYDEMPFYLRQCFAFFALYPKDFTFYGRHITNLWIAHGLVQSRNTSEDVEDIARAYIDELNSRSFLQDFKDYGYKYTFKVNDLIHDLALYVTREDFVVVNLHTPIIPEQAQHLSIVESVSLGHTFTKSKRVRTILFPIQGVGLESENLLSTWVSTHKYLRYLNLDYSSFETLPTSIDKLKHLCVLQIRYNRRIKRLPRSICKLQSLQVLALSGCTELETLPEGIGKLTSLRQLCITTKQSVLSQDEFASLNHLRSLRFYQCDNLKFLFRGRQAQLSSLEKLDVESCGSLESLPLYIFPKLQTLLIEDCKKLNLSLKFKDPIQKLRMKHLYLEDLPQLVTLPQWIGGAVDTLETLVIKKIPNLEMLPECLTTMTRLKRLRIVNCPRLLSLPSDIHRLTALEELHIYRCPELCRKCRAPSGEYQSMIAHIKQVSIALKGKVDDEGAKGEKHSARGREQTGGSWRWRR